MTTWLLLRRGHTDRSNAGRGKSPLLPAPDGAQPRQHLGFRLWALGHDTFPLLSVFPLGGHFLPTPGNQCVHGPGFSILDHRLLICLLPGVGGD